MLSRRLSKAFREVRRRTRPMSCFQNSVSVEGTIYRVISHLSKAWEENLSPIYTQPSDTTGVNSYDWRHGVRRVWRDDP